MIDIGNVDPRVHIYIDILEYSIGWFNSILRLGLELLSNKVSGQVFCSLIKVIVGYLIVGIIISRV